MLSVGRGVSPYVHIALGVSVPALGFCVVACALLWSRWWSRLVSASLLGEDRPVSALTTGTPRLEDPLSTPRTLNSIARWICRLAKARANGQATQEESQITPRIFAGRFRDFTLQYTKIGRHAHYMPDRPNQPGRSPKTPPGQAQGNRPPKSSVNFGSSAVSPPGETQKNAHPN